MSVINRYDYSPKLNITAQKFQGNDNYLWIAHAQNTSGNCILQKVFGLSPTQIFYTLNRAVDKIVAMDADATYLYLAYEDNLLLGEIINLNNPLSITTEISTISGLLEYPVDIKVTANYIYFLIPGSISGSNAQILRFNLNGTYIDTVNLVESSNIVTNAKSMTIDSTTGDIWIGTYESPANLVRVYQVRVIA